MKIQNKEGRRYKRKKIQNNEGRRYKTRKEEGMKQGTAIPARQDRMPGEYTQLGSDIHSANPLNRLSETNAGTSIW